MVKNCTGVTDGVTYLSSVVCNDYHFHLFVHYTILLVSSKSSINLKTYKLLFKKIENFYFGDCIKFSKIYNLKFFKQK